MFFYLKYRFGNGIGFQVIKNGHAVPTENPLPDSLYLDAGRQQLFDFRLKTGRLILLGDPVWEGEAFPLGILFSKKGTLDQEKLYEEIRGHYYWFHLREGRLNCGASFGAILPVYYRMERGQCTVCSSSFYLAEKTGASENDNRNFLERLLFNYPLFNSTWWENISLLGTHRYLGFSPEGCKVAGDFRTDQHFNELEDHSRKSLDRLAQLFEKEVGLFLPDSPFAISLTGGFDGRTLVALARKKGKDFLTFCYGTPGNSSDLAFSTSISGKLNLPHLPVTLDEKYLAEAAFLSAKNFMQLTEFNGNFGRPHYDYEARLLSEKVTHMLTGNFGSELFRALHSSGSVMTDCLVDIFSAKDDSWKDRLQLATHAWSPELFENETDGLIADIGKYLEGMAGLDPNHRFYRFVFDEIFRKYFGPEIVMQSHYLSNRTPYLSLRFLQELTRTKWAGIHSRIYEKNLIKRRKGQVFYANFLKKTDSDLYRLPTNNGYSPADVLEPWRLPRLLSGVFSKKYLKKREVDSNSTRAFFYQNHRQLATGILDGSDHPMIENLIKQSLNEIPARRNLPRWIKFYSITAGWRAAANQKNSLWKPAPYTT